MKIELDVDYDDAVKFRDWLRKWHGTITFDFALAVLGIAGDIDSAIDDENERRGVEQAERDLESGGFDDSKYRADMKDAGREHLLR